jgi:DNA-binding protein HU-beta
MFKPMNKTDLINVVASEAGLSKKQAESAVNATIAAIAGALKNGDKVQLIGFGTFEVKDVAAREGRNPKTGEVIKIEASKKPAFSASKALKDQING